MLPIGVIGSLLALIRRFRRSSGIERLQLRLLVTTASFVAILYTVALLVSFAGSWGVNQPTWMTILQSVSVFSFGLIPIAIGVSVLRYHLFDIDVVINRALLYGTIAVVITAVYVGIVVGIGALVGSRGEPILSAAAAAIIAIAFQPLRIRAQRFADRMVYGERAAPYEVLSEFSERLGNTYANDQLLPRMAAALAGGTGAIRADVWVRIGDQLVYTFAAPRRIAQASEKELRDCKLGYRAKNLRATARLVSSGQADLEAWSALSDAELRKQLCALPGVGPKIANCVMLFAYERLRAFPIDVWIERVLRQHYFSRRRKMTALRLHEFCETYFGEHGGYAQQYLFHHARMNGRTK